MLKFRLPSLPLPHHGILPSSAAGCGGLKVVPVPGTATVDGNPLVGFVVTFTPEADQGHEARMDCSGRLGVHGRYSIRTDDGFKQYKGAPPGWYKVTIWSPDDKCIPFDNPARRGLAVEQRHLRLGLSRSRAKEKQYN